LGRGSWGRPNKKTWRPRVKNGHGQRTKEKPSVPHHHLSLPPRAPSPSRTPRKRTPLIVFINFGTSLDVHGRPWQTKKSGAQAGAGGGATPHHFRQGVSESADTCRFHPPACPVATLPFTVLHLSKLVMTFRATGLGPNPCFTGPGPILRPALVASESGCASYGFQLGGPGAGGS
jgi:hypothetical protein